VKRALALACVLAWPLRPDCAELTPFALDAVRLTSGPFLRAQQNDLRYVMSLDPDRLLAPYRREAGLPSPVESYGSWEATGLDGHIGGHALSALSMLHAATGRQDVHERLNYMVAELKKCQDANGNGYLGGVPGSKTLWGEVAAGRIDAESFSLNGRWVPWYNLHKLFAGLRDAYVHGGIEPARGMLVELADWCLEVTSDLSDEQMQAMLRAEHGGMNEVLADVAALTGETKYLGLARRFSDRALLGFLLDGEDRLTSLHANTQIAKVVGFKRIADLADDRTWNNAARFFWTTVVANRTVAIGGNSVREHFHPPDDFSPMIAEVEGPETCNTYNMLRLSKLLFLTSGAETYIDYYETALFNHILSSQHPEHGGLVYFTPLRPQHYRVYSQPQQAMWCCVGSGIENHARYGELIYAHTDDELYVNLYLPSTLRWKERDIELRQRTDLPESDTVTLEVGADEWLTLKVRYPRWVEKGALSVSINGELVAVTAGPGEYVALRRQWRRGDLVSLTLPMHVDTVPMPDGSDYFAMRYGPVVLAARTGACGHESPEYLADDSRMGHVPDGALCPLDRAPVLVGDPADVVKGIARSESPSLAFRLSRGVDWPDKDALELVPFSSVHDSRYIVYWPAVDKEELGKFRCAGAKAEEARLALEALTIDQVAPGEQQPESEHSLRGEQTESGVNLRRRWRHATGWFSYQLEDPGHEAKLLQITYFGAGRGRQFDILVNDVTIATVALAGERGAEFYTVDYPVPGEVAAASDGTLEAKFVAHEGSTAGGIYHVRLLRGTGPDQADPGGE